VKRFTRSVAKQERGETWKRFARSVTRHLYLPTGHVWVRKQAQIYHGAIKATYVSCGMCVGLVYRNERNKRPDLEVDVRPTLYFLKFWPHAAANVHRHANVNELFTCICKYEYTYMYT